MDVLTKEQRTKNMKAIKSQGTKDEVLLAKVLWKKGYRYRKNDKTVFGKPDLTFKKYKIAIFVDSEYFHGKDWEVEKFRIKSNIIVNETLINAGWTVLRFWSKDLRKDMTTCLKTIENEIGIKKDAYLQREEKRIKY